MSRSMPVDKLVGERLRKAREAEHISQQALADTCGLTRQQIQKYESGSNRIAVSRLVQLAHAMGYETSAFLRQLDEPDQVDDDGLLDDAGERLAKYYGKCDIAGRQALMMMAKSLAERTNR
jgi:transcriptional regulator with XRE-family HTH domain